MTETLNTKRIVKEVWGIERSVLEVELLGGFVLDLHEGEGPWLSMKLSGHGYHQKQVKWPKGTPMPRVYSQGGFDGFATRLSINRFLAAIADIDFAFSPGRNVWIADDPNARGG